MIGIALTILSTGALVEAHTYAPHPQDEPIMQHTDRKDGGHHGTNGVLE